MEGGEGARGASSGCEGEGTWRGASFHADKHGKFSVDVQQPRLMKEAEELEVRVMETRVWVLSEERPPTLAGMSNPAFARKDKVAMKKLSDLWVSVFN